MKAKIECDLRPHFGSARDQGARPTCLAFAATDAHASIRDGWHQLSTEYLFHHAQKRAARLPSCGASLAEILASLEKDGQPYESAWPYMLALPQDLSQYLPPASVGDRFGRFGEQLPATVAEIVKNLDKRLPLIALIKLTSGFFKPPASGVIHYIDDERVRPAPRHAVVCVGYGEIEDRKAVLVRNSWGPSWGLSGYIWLTEAYLENCLFGVAILKGANDVTGNSKSA